MDDSADPLAALRDIHLPLDPTFWPPASGWWFIAIALLVSGWLIVRAWTKYDRYRRPAREFRHQLMALDIYSSDAQKLTVVRQMSRLVRQLAICRYGRERVAGLYGDSWLRFLDSTTKGEPEFSIGAGKILGDAPYRPYIDVDLVRLRVFLVGWSKRGLKGSSNN